MADRLHLIVPEAWEGERLDSYLAAAQESITRSGAQKLIAEGQVLLNGRLPAKNARLKPGDEILLTIPEPKPLDAEPENIPLDIVYEDDALLVVNKPKGMVVHPAPGNESGTLVNALLYHCQGRLSGINGVIRPGIVHRIDKDTSGLLIVAKTDQAHLALSEQIKAHSFTRQYEAVLYGNLKEDSRVVDAPIGRHKTDRKKMCVTAEHSRNAYTTFEVIARYEGFTHVRAILKTGRTHQIRVHAAYIGHPVAGDPVYGPKKVIAQLGGQCLHAGLIGFIHPVTGEYLEFHAPLPEYFTNFLAALRRLSD